jgi:hypothetical protein
MNSTRQAHHLVLLGFAPLMLTMSLPFTARAAPPAEAIQAGDTVNTFSSDFTAQTVDMNRTLNRGYKWYLADMFSVRSNPAGVKINSDGSVTLLGDKTGAVGALMSIAPYRGTNTFVGTAFGGGAYIEAVMSYTPAQVTATHTGAAYPYPAFWSLPMEGNVIAGAAQWPGQAAGYQHSVEVDFFEADYPTAPTRYGVGLHDWWGIPGVTCPPGLCKVSPPPPAVKAPPAGTNFAQYHTYGFLWVPATSTTKGFVEAFFDGTLAYSYSWSQYTNQPPTPAGQPWAFGRLDTQHMFFILGTGVGETFNVKSVNVWQNNAASNMSN